MTDQVRWSDASSDADPVLRAVLRYAQQLAPSAQDVASIATAVARAEAELASGAATSRALSRRRFAWAKPSRRVVAWGGSLAFLGAAAVSAAMNLDLLDFRPSVAVLEPEVIHDQVVPVVRSAAARAQRPAPSPVPAKSVPVPQRTPAESVSPSLPSAASAAADGSSELSLLTTARRALTANPEKCLALLATHRTRYPSSSFAEERAALRVEALFRSGRLAEAERDLSRFSERFPGSIYAPRLSAIGQR